MSDEINRKFCIEYCMRRGMPREETEKFAVVILIIHKRQPEKTLRQVCDFSLRTLDNIKKQDNTVF